MSAAQVYDVALSAMPPKATIGMKAAVEAINNGEYDIAATLLRATADQLEDSNDDA